VNLPGRRQQKIAFDQAKGDSHYASMEAALIARSHLIHGIRNKGLKPHRHDE
jgi:hypothetical protein